MNTVRDTMKVTTDDLITTAIAKRLRRLLFVDVKRSHST